MRTEMRLKLNDSQMLGLRQLANTENKSISALIRKLINELLEKKNLQPDGKQH